MTEENLNWDAIREKIAEEVGPERIQAAREALNPHWFYYSLEGEMYLNHDVPQGMDPAEYAVQLMGDDGGTEATLNLVRMMLEQGLVGLGVRPALEKRALAFNQTVEVLKQPIDPDQLVYACRTCRARERGEIDGGQAEADGGGLPQEDQPGSAG